MKTTGKKLLALVMCVVMTCTAAFSAQAASGQGAFVGTPAQHTLDKVLDKVLDGLIGGLTRMLLTADSGGLLLKNRRYPTQAEFLASSHDGFYAGTDGALTGTGWSLGYASRSVIPTAWRCDADGKSDPNGMCFTKAHYFGGYFGSKVHNVYDDERVNLAVLSAGTDRNQNGVEDIVIYASLDNIGVSNGTTQKVRAAVQEALAKQGVAKEDILTIQFACTHAHTVVEALGMSLGTLFGVAFKNHFLFTRDSAVEPELLSSICAQTADAACEAYGKMERGTLYYFETENVNDYMQKNAVNPDADGSTNMIREKLKYGAGLQKFFACWYFESRSGERTMLANIGMHPTGPRRGSDRVCADMPYYMGQVLRDEGVNFVFMQGAQAAIGLGHYYTAEGKAYAQANTLTYADWVARYGASYADAHYAGNDDEDGEEEYFGLRAAGYSLAHFLLSSIDRSNAVAPVVDAHAEYTMMPVDYDVIYLAAVSNAFGYNTVRGVDSETGYGIMTEIGYVALGDSVVMLTLPGEVSPALVYGTDPDWTGSELWYGATSWRNENWPYAPIAVYAQKALGENKRILSLGLANDELGYIVPTTDTAKNFLTKSFLNGRGDNEELMAPCADAGTFLTESFKQFFESLAR